MNGKVEAVCGRYAASKRADQLVEEFDVDVDSTDGKADEPDYNVAPTKTVPMVVTRRPKGEDEDSEPGEPQRQLRAVRWGLVPSWAKDPSIGSRMINARAETVATKPAFKRAFAKRRCILPADGYYEWYLPDPDALAAGEELEKTKAGKPRKQPFFIHPADGQSLAMAGLYEFWRDTTRQPDDELAWWVTCTVLTTDATDELGRIHDRMPLVVPREAWSQWLDPDDEAPLDLLIPAGESGLIAHPVSDAVNAVQNNDPSLVKPIARDKVLKGVVYE